MGSLLSLARASELVPRPRSALPAPPRHLDLVLDDVRLKSVAAAQRQAILQAVAQLLLEASGAVTAKAGDDDA
jgi:hypothetical protein